MNTYHKIQTVFLRDPETNYKTLLEGTFAKPEFEYLKDAEWVFTEKVDGTNIRIMWDGEKIKFGGKTNSAQTPMDLISALYDIFNGKEEVFSNVFANNTDMPTSVCLYGEGYGPGIQKGGGNYRDNKSFVLFDVKVGDAWLERADVESIGLVFGLDVVPVVLRGSLGEMIELCRNGITSTWGSFQSEGLIGRPAIELRDHKGDRVITKLKCTDFKK